MTEPGTSSAQVVASDDQIIQHLKACQHIAVEWSEGKFTGLVKRFSALLLEYADDAKSNHEQRYFADAERTMRLESEEFRRYFCGYLGEGFVKFKSKQLDTHTGEEKYGEDMLSLVDNADLEETIAITSLTQREENQHADTLWALNQRFALLNGGDQVHDRSNPVGPVQFCESMKKALKLFEFDTRIKLIAFKALDQELMEGVGEVLEATNHYLSEAGLLPNLRYSPAAAVPNNTAGAPITQPNANLDEIPAESVEAQPELVPSPSPFSSPQPVVPNNLLGAIRGLQGQLNQRVQASSQLASQQTQGASAVVPLVSNPGAGVAAPVEAYNSDQLVVALQTLQQQTQSLAGQEINQIAPVVLSEANLKMLEQLKEDTGKEGGVDENDMHTIDLVGMLFEYMLSDDKLPDSVKALLSYLHTPFMKIAFIDKNFFEEVEHPARLLLNNMAEAGTRWIGNDGSSQYGIYEKIKETVSRVLEDFKNDVRLFAELLIDFSAYTKKISRRQELMEKRATEKAQGEEKLREVKILVNTEVRNRTDGRELPSAVLLLLLQPWSDYLSFVLLRYGEQSDSWQRAVSVIDDVIWSIQPKTEASDRARQLEMHDQLLDLIETGFETIGYDQAKGRKLLEALISLQKLALQSKAAEPAPEPMRAKLETMADEKAGKPQEPAESISVEEQKMIDNLKMIEFGTWFELDGGKRLKVAWYNAKTSHYMMVDQMGKKVAMKSGLELAREMISGDARVIAGSSKPFFERALENIFHNLNAKAEALDEDQQ